MVAQAYTGARFPAWLAQLQRFVRMISRSCGDNCYSDLPQVPIWLHSQSVVSSRGRSLLSRGGARRLQSLALLQEIARKHRLIADPCWRCWRGAYAVSRLLSVCAEVPQI